jgi:hypothetical protein
MHALALALSLSLSPPFFFSSPLLSSPLLFFYSLLLSFTSSVSLFLYPLLRAVSLVVLLLSTCTGRGLDSLSNIPPRGTPSTFLPKAFRNLDAKVERGETRESWQFILIEHSA